MQTAGPIDPATHFPAWFKDEKGLALEPVLAADPYAPAIGVLPQPGASVIAAPGFTNFPDEAFYYFAEARLQVGGAGIVGRARIIMSLEAGFGGAGFPAPGMNVVFGRLRIRIDDVLPGGEYTVRHPYGDTDPLPADEKGRVSWTVDLGIAEGNVTQVLKTGQIAPFLVWDTGAPTGYIGDGVTEHTVINAPELKRLKRLGDETSGFDIFACNYIEIKGPRIAEGSVDAVAGNPDLVRRELFIIQGRKARSLGVEATSVTYSKEGASTVLNVAARSDKDQKIEAVAGDWRVALAGHGPDYTARVQVPVVPADLRILNASDTAVSATSVPKSAITDRVIVEKATLDVETQRLTVVARSSDPAARLTAVARIPDPAKPVNPLDQFGVMTASPHVFTGVTAAPALITVTSDKGGIGTQHLELIGAGAAQLGVAAGASRPNRAVAGLPFRLDGTGSRGAIASYAWSQTSGPAGTLVNGALSVAQFTPAVAGTYVFRLTVNGPGGPSTSDVTVTVEPALDADNFFLPLQRAEYRTGRQEYRITGRINNPSTYNAALNEFVANEIIVKLGAFEIGRAYPDATGVWDIRRTLSGNNLANIPGVGTSVTVSTATLSRSFLQLITIRN
ncbi:MAG: hypothetical protein LBG44_07760 [Gemmatimonadota bacterium]|nr:hypothetical protein [Gemmatimonadota bacterium]